MIQGRNDIPWPDTARIPSSEDLLAPRTQLVGDRDAYLGQGRNDIGRRISEDQVELFVTGDVSTSLEQEFALHTPEFLALHDLGTSASLKLLSSLVAGSGAPVQRLSIRRQGQGVALAVLRFVEVPLADGTPVRVYSTDVNADGPARARMARLLLGHSRLGVIIVGEVPAQALTAQLTPFHEAILRGPWPNRDLLLVPLGSSIGLAAPGAQLALKSQVAVHVTPHAAKPKHVWTFIGGAWNRLHDATNNSRALPTELPSDMPKPRVPRPQATTEAILLESAISSTRAPAPAPASPHAQALMASSLQSITPMPVPGATSWQAYVDRCVLIKGAVSCCVFDAHSMEPLASAGGPPAADRMAKQGAALLSAMNNASRALGLGPARAEACISTTHHHLLLRPVPGHPGVALHMALQASTSNVTLARMQLERIDPPR